MRKVRGKVIATAYIRLQKHGLKRDEPFRYIYICLKSGEEVLVRFVMVMKDKRVAHIEGPGVPSACPVGDCRLTPRQFSR